MLCRCYVTGFSKITGRFMGYIYIIEGEKEEEREREKQIDRC